LIMNIKLFKGKYICHCLGMNHFIPKFHCLLIGWNKEKPSTEGNKTSVEAASALVPVPEMAAPVPGNVANASARVAEVSSLMNPDDHAWQMLFASFLQTMLQDY